MVEPSPHIQVMLKKLVHKLIAGDFEEMEAQGYLLPGTSQGTRETLEHTYASLTMPPPEAFTNIKDVLELPPLEKGERRWFLVFDLWLDGEQSELKLEAEYTEKEIGR